ncbi:unnamed protein product [Caenorhabditis angaria]|uniref:Uncharacterized protein n=1 Tax=Caenorhabditis angaria TaxID=860376 RepID=A0A9P1MTQ3_9PELO|nr:unnamed protein product [Caenorhabditis angaria]
MACSSFFSSEYFYRCFHGPNGCLVPSRPTEGQPIENQFDELESKLSILAKKRSDEIERYLDEQKRKNDGILNILILGGPSSGKSTIFKQMQIIHRDGYKDADELESFKNLIYENIFDIFQQLQNGARIIGISLENLKCHVDSVAEGEFWISAEIQRVFSRRYEFELMDSTKYYLSNLNRLSQPGYIPNYEDIVHSRRPTKNIHTMIFTYTHLKLKLIDVGGQKSERRKWLPLFEDSRVILFVIDLTGYAKKSEESRLEILRSAIFQKWWEDPGNVSDLKVALKIFEDVSNNAILKNAVFLMFFNKFDLFEELLRDFEIERCFSKFKGKSGDLDECSDFIRQKFLRAAKHRKSIYPHFTTATNTENIKMVFRASMESVFKANSRSTGLQ